MAVCLRVLIVEDSEHDTELLVAELRRGGFDPQHRRVDSPETMTAALDGQEWDVVLADFSMPGFSGVEALRLLRAREVDLPFIFVSGTIGEETAVAAMRAGAHDYVMKDNLRRLVPALERELREAQIRRERRAAETRIQHLAFYDALTDLPNRALLRDRLERGILAGLREKQALALLILDLDRFKEINDSLGHPAGDLVLQEVGRRIRGTLREADTVARLGGDEFAVLLGPSAAEEARLVAQRIVEAVERPLPMLELALHVGTSLGIAIFPAHGTDADSLIQHADMAMYAAKERGGGIAVYGPELDRHNPVRLALMGDLREAAARQQLVLLYQPQVDLRTREVTGLEALVRWNHPVHGAMLPERFIGLAEETGFIGPLTQWTLEAALRQIAALRRAGRTAAIAVNLSPSALQDLNLPDRIARLCETCGAAPGWLELEVTENVIMSDPIRAREILTRIGRMGARIAIDDFGTGYSSLSYLRNLLVHRIKIDKSFVVQMAFHDDEAIVRSTIDLGHNLGLQVIAEGVETAESWDRLRALGCDAAQGFYISEPLDGRGLQTWLAAWERGGP